jgi:hypothetical protein
VAGEAAGGRQVPHLVTALLACASAQVPRSVSDAEHALTYEPVHVMPRGGVPVIVRHPAQCTRASDGLSVRWMLST